MLVGGGGAVIGMGTITTEELGDAIGNAISNWWNELWDENSREIQREDEYQGYKSRCNEKPPEGLSDCEKKEWELQQAKDCRDMRQAWDDKWYPGRHNQAIRDWNNRVKKIERTLKNIKKAK